VKKKNFLSKKYFFKFFAVFCQELPQLYVSKRKSGEKYSSVANLQAPIVLQPQLLPGCAVLFRIEAKLSETEAKFFVLRSKTEEFVSLVSL
jgi:hypothetical protein